MQPESVLVSLHKEAQVCHYAGGGHHVLVLSYEPPHLCVPPYCLVICLVPPPKTPEELLVVTLVLLGFAPAPPTPWHVLLFPKIDCIRCVTKAS